LSSVNCAWNSETTDVDISKAWFSLNLRNTIRVKSIICECRGVYTWASSYSSNGCFVTVVSPKHSVRWSEVQKIVSRLSSNTCDYWVESWETVSSGLWVNCKVFWCDNETASSLWILGSANKISRAALDVLIHEKINVNAANSRESNLCINLLEEHAA
jgi:hypothetical protein